MPHAASPTRLSPDVISARARALAREAGFAAVGIAPAANAPGAGEALRDFIALGRHGDMDWLAARLDARASPQGLWPEARSVIMVGENYGPDEDPLGVLDRKSAAGVSVYARGRDYHDVVKKRLKRFARALIAEFGGEVKVFVDTAPVMEKPLGEMAGIGWRGKHTNLVSRAFGSWLFLGAVYTTLALATDDPETDHCGACRRCLDVCPTDAFPAPYELDARRCISYLTIEHKGPIPHEFREAMGNRVYGCDDCLAVCPWNKFAERAHDAKLRAREDLNAPRLADLARLDDAAFRAFFAGSPVKRTGRDRFLRNVMIAIGNSGDAALIPVARARLEDASPLVRSAAVWAASRLLPREDLAQEAAARAPAETDPDVRAEWAIAAGVMEKRKAVSGEDGEDGADR